MTIKEGKVESGGPWFESNLLWGPVGFLLAATASAKHDLRWLLWLSWPCFAVVIWRLARRTQEVLVVTLLGTALVGFGLRELNVWLRPEQRKAAPVTPAVQSVNPPSSPAPAKAPAPTQPRVAKKAKHELPFLPGPQLKPEAASAPPATQQTVNAPNGIGTIGGTLVNPQVNNFGYMPKKLTGDQMENISALMRPWAREDPDGNLITCQLGNAESCTVAIQLVKAFRGAGWTLGGTGYSQALMSEAPEPVLIFIKADTLSNDQPIVSGAGLPPGAYELARALTESGLSVSFARDTKMLPSQFRIVVGTRP